MVREGQNIFAGIRRPQVVRGAGFGNHCTRVIIRVVTRVITKVAKIFFTKVATRFFTKVVTRVVTRVITRVSLSVKSTYSF